MDNYDIDEIPPRKEADEPIPFDDDDANVSHSPLDLSGGGNPAPASEAAPKIEKPQPEGLTARKSVETVTSSERITGVRTFFTKLHPGAIDFLDEQITNWLKNNPDVVIKRTNTVTGEIQAKKTEPNIIVTVWY